MKKIMVIDDEEDIRDGLEALFESSYKVITSGTLDEAKEKIRDNEDIALILLDMSFENDPEAGVQIAKFLNAAYPLIRFIVITGHPSVETYRVTSYNGSIQYLTKTTDFAKQIQAKVHELVPVH